MRVLFVSSGLDPRTGGTATAAISIAIAAARAGITPTLAFPIGPAKPDDPGYQAIAAATLRLKGAGVETKVFPFADISSRPGISKQAIAWGVSPALGRWMGEQADNFDVIIAHSPWVASTLSAVAVARRNRKPIVLMPHEGLTRFDMGSSSAKGAAGSALKIGKAVLRSWYLSKVDRVVVSSELERLDSNLKDTVRDRVIAHPVYDETAPPALLPARKTFEGDGTVELTVGFLGRFHPKKNLERLIDALSFAPGTRLVVAGDGEAGYRDELKALARSRSVADRVEWLGFLAEDQKRQFFATIDILAVPSRFECFGLVVVEALSHGVPVIVSPTVGVADAVEADGCGLVVPPRGDALAVAFGRAADTATRAGWAAQARSTALARFSFATHGQALRGLVEELMRK